MEEENWADFSESPESKMRKWFSERVARNVDVKVEMETVGELTELIHELLEENPEERIRHCLEVMMVLVHTNAGKEAIRTWGERLRQCVGTAEGFSSSFAGECLYSLFRHCAVKLGKKKDERRRRERPRLDLSASSSAPCAPDSGPRSQEASRPTARYRQPYVNARGVYLPFGDASGREEKKKEEQK